jgi:hypothetical protein
MRFIPYPKKTFQPCHFEWFGGKSQRFTNSQSSTRFIESFKHSSKIPKGGVMKTQNISKIRIVLCLLAVGFPVKGMAQSAGSGKETVLDKNISLEAPKEFWSKKSGILKYKCKDMKLFAQSKFNPGTQVLLSDGPFNPKDCKSSVKSLENNGCFCDEGKLRCMETERVEPAAYLCNSDLKCLVFEGQKKGILKIADVGDHITRQKCEEELKEVSR